MDIDLRCQPVAFDLKRSEGLAIRWADGVESWLSLSTLRKACPCATCRTKREAREPGSLTVIAGQHEQAKQATASNAELVGNYAIRISWADGHDLGIYDFRYLRQLADDASPQSASRGS